MKNTFKNTDKATSGNDEGCPVILHISDLHFGKPMTSGELRDRQIVFGQFMETLTGLSPDWKPNYVCITGDVSNENNSDGYIEGAKWLVDLMTNL